MSEKTAFPESPLKGEHWPLTPEEELALFLEMEHAKLQADPSHALPAFQALTYVMASIWRQDEHPSPTHSVTVPMWAAETIAQGFMQYQDTAKQKYLITLGEAYGIEGGGQGKQPKIKAYLRQLRDIRIATQIAMREESGIKLEAALQEMADKTNLSLGNVRRVWERHSGIARSALSNFRTRKTS